MRRGVGILVVCSLALGVATDASADGFEFGVETGATFPLSKTKRSMGDVGGSIGLPGGYRFNMGQNFALSIIGQPNFFAFPTETGFPGSNMSSNFSYTVGPKFTLLTKWVTAHAGAQGGYYQDLTGPMDDGGAGFNGNAGVSYRLDQYQSLGVFGRYDYSTQDAAPSSTDSRQMVTGGLQYLYSWAQPEPPPPAPEPPPPAAPAKRKIILRGVNFDFDKSNIRADAQPILNAAIDVLKAEPGINVSVQGYTDSIGSDAYNLKLSQRRAESVTRYMVTGGVSATRLTAVGFGESDPVATNETEDGRAQNRRVELRVLGE
ncbi:MAG: OmpA family protein [Candidatus Binatia bacterium]|nr:OmpA family protein [Candidatus Binatia bacterium]